MEELMTSYPEFKRLVTDGDGRNWNSIPWDNIDSDDGSAKKKKARHK